MTDGGVEPTQIAVNGAAGRMGQTVIETAAEREDVAVAFGLDVGGGDGAEPVPTYRPGGFNTAVMKHDVDVVVDFTVPAATAELAPQCAERGLAMVVGTTGFGDEDLATLEAASEDVPVLKAANFSRGIQALLRALEPALEALSAYDVELSETHHNGKRDAPSGTANTILETVQDHRDLEPVYGREGDTPRSADEVGVLVSRLGDVRGEHEVRLGGNDEVLSIAHRAEDRGVFAAGALDAAVWLADRDPGWYPFGEVIDDT